MTFDLIFEQDYTRIIPAVINDSWSIIPQTKMQFGSVIKSYSDSQLALIVPGVLPYRIESNEGNLAGYMALQVNNNVATVLLFQLRPGFVALTNQISQNIGTFIQSNLWLNDMLY